MSYISIIDLPELKSISSSADEFLLVTNSNLESNKLKLNTLTSYVDDKIEVSVNTVVQEAIDKLHFISNLDVYDEGIKIGSSNRINFIGETVNTFLNDETGIIDVYIPSALTSSFFNSNNASTNTKVKNSSYTNRIISKPLSNFDIGNWTPGSLQKCINSNLYYQIDEYIYLDYNGFFNIDIIQNNNVIETLTFNISQKTFSSQHIIAELYDLKKEQNHFIAKLKVWFNLSSFINGRFNIRIKYQNNLDSYEFVENDLFFDGSQTTSTINITPEFGVKNYLFLSGVKYIGTGSTIKYNVILKNAKDLTMPENICDIDGSYCGISSYNILVNSLNLTDYTYNTDINFNLENTLLNNKFYNGDLIIKGRVNDWNVGAYSNFTFRGLVCTYSDTSTRVYEDFVSETNRLNADFNKFDGSKVLSQNDLQVYNSKLVYPQLDFSEFLNNPNYSSYVGARTYLRMFWHSNVSHSNGLFYLNSNIKEEDLKSNVKFEISLDKINWFDCSKDYVGGELINGSGCRINTDSNSLNINNKMEFTLGLNKFSNASSSWGIYVKITFLESAKTKYIDVLQITNW